MATNDEKPSIELFETDAGGMIRGGAGEGGITEIHLSQADVFWLARAAPRLRNRLLSRLRGDTGSVVARVSVPVTTATLNVDLLARQVQLTLTDPTGVDTTFALSDEVAASLAERLPALLAEAKAKRSATKQ